MDRTVKNELERARQALLDLTPRNRLLNFRPTRRTTLRVVDERPAEVWRLLVAERKALAFLAREEHELHGSAALLANEPADEPAQTQVAPPQELAPEPAPVPPAAPALPPPSPDTAFDEDEKRLAARYTDLFLQTPVEGETLQVNLLRIDQAARAALEDRGVNLLFLAVGFLHWQDDTAARGRRDRAFAAPVLLIPVELRRTSAQRRFKLAATDDEPILNPCLVRKLHDFRVRIPEPPESWEGFDVQAYLDAVAAAVKDRPGWQVQPDLYLGLFSFTKYAMYVDLDPNRWPRERNLLTNPLIRGLCGVPAALTSEQAPMPDAAELDALQDPADVFQIVDADSSQQAAVLAAKRGRSFVIAGPPGTGKSQTITNIIAESLSQGQTVLFVSQKMAALEVVKRRLDEAGIGDFCLELHSTKANKRALLEELRRTLEAPRLPEQDFAHEAARLTRLRDRLNAYVAALHEPFGRAALAPYEAIGRVALLAEAPDVFCRMPAHDEWRRAQVDFHREQVAHLARQLRVVDSPAAHPWRGSRLTAVGAQTRREAGEQLARLRAAVGQVGEVLRRTRERLGAAGPADAPGTPQDAGAALAAAEVVLASPGIERRLLEDAAWDAPPAEVQGLLEAARGYASLRRWLAGRYRPERIDGADFAGVLQRDRAYGRKASRFLRPAWWADRKLRRQALAEGYCPSPAERSGDLERLARLQGLRAQLEQAAEAGTRWFGSAWSRAAGASFGAAPGDLAAEAQAWEALPALAEWLGGFRREVRARRIGEPGLALATEGGDRDALVEPAAALRAALEAWQVAWGALRRTAELQDPGTFDAPAERVPLADLANRFEAMEARLESLYEWGQFQEALQACEAGPLAEFAVAAIAQDLEPEVLPLAFEKQYLRLWLDDVFAQREPLRRFNGRNHDADALEFARLDRQWQQLTRDRLAQKLQAQRPAADLQAAASSKLGILLGELRRKRGGRPIRKLLRDADEPIQRIKPCFMMSPLSVAQFLDAEGMRFDVVIFDEASQVEPADGLGAVARCMRPPEGPAEGPRCGTLILVGDPNQLPPTNFFTALGGEGEAPGDDDAPDAAALTDMESILDRGLVVLPRLPLRWHYRSRHESLIAYSNAEFYGGELVVFPSSHAEGERLGLHLRYEPGDLYDRGRSQTNRAQAQRIARQVFEHARQHPELSLGVGAFNVQQQQAILDELERLRREDDALEPFFSRERPEPFFVKNLETIQGDERDVIFLSVGYGRARPDERLSMNFGPLNKDGGWRRLNVLITRARRACVVFSSIDGHDFDLSATQARGVRALKGYLDYARSGELPAAAVGGGQGASAFEQAVYNALAEQGLALHRQVGCAGCTVDLAVVDADNPQRYLLGIECDGGTYRGAGTARDRDRLRQQVLEGLGWRIHRIWSVDWYNKPQTEIRRVLDAVELARKGQLEPQRLGLLAAGPAMAGTPGPKLGEEPAEAPAPGTFGERAIASEPALPAVEVEPYAFYGDAVARQAEQFYTAAMPDLAELVTAIVAREGPIHEEELLRRLAGLWSIGRVGSRVQQRGQRAAKFALDAGTIVQRGAFLWPTGMDVPPVRRRDENGARDIERIALEEIGCAARRLLQAQFGMPRADLVSQTARLLGFRATGPRLAERIDQAVEAELAAGRIGADVDGMLKAWDA